MINFYICTAAVEQNRLLMSKILGKTGIEKKNCWKEK